jgi:acetyl-CoA C-acetyltransferase
VLVAEHPDLGRSPAMAAAAAEAMRCANVGIDDIGHLDLYSCFASSLHFAQDALGLAAGDARGVTVTGGLPYHGGPASGYLTHSIAAMVERLRADPGAMGAVSGVGMHMTKHVFGVYSSEPRPVTPPSAVPAPATVPVVAGYDGTATVAAYSVVHDRDGGPARALLVCDLPDGARTYANLTDLDECRRAEEEELVGERVLLQSARVDGAFGPGTVNRAEIHDRSGGPAGG